MDNTYYVKPAVFNEGRPNWNGIEKASMNHHLWLPHTDINASVKLCYDKEGIYVKLEAREKNIIAVYHGDYDMVCEDSCLEFFFSPCEKDDRYFNFEINPNGAYYLGFGYSNQDNVRLYIQDGRNQFKIHTYRDQDGWAAEYKIPASFIKIFVPSFQLEEGLRLRGNFYKCGDHTPVPHYISWNEVKSEKPNFHLPAYFGSLVFV